MSMEVLTKRLTEIVEIAKKDLTTFDIFSYMNEILQLVNRDEELKDEIEAWQGKVIVFEAIDTGRSISINFTDGVAIGQITKRNDFNLKFEATERTYLELLTGELDPDSAFFKRKIIINGSIPLAFRFKNVFFAKVLAVL